jgi:hypothetical protein
MPQGMPSSQPARTLAHYPKLEVAMRHALALLMLVTPAVAQDGKVINKVQTSNFATVTADIAPPVPGDTIAAVLADPVQREAILAAAFERLGRMEPYRELLRTSLTTLLADPESQALFRDHLYVQFDNYGFVPDQPEQIVRVAGLAFVPWALESGVASRGYLSVPDQRQALTNMVRVAEALEPDACAEYISSWTTPDVQMQHELQVMTSWPPAEAAAAMALILRSGVVSEASLADGALLPAADGAKTRRALGIQVVAAINALPDPDKAFAALAPFAWNDPEGTCDATVIVMKTALAMSGQDGEDAIKLLLQVGLDGV